jgi:hypothetical protein
MNPIWLCYDWSMGCIKNIEDAGDIRILTVIVTAILFGAILVASFRQRYVPQMCSRAIKTKLND